jgi:hypothetical protein
MTAAVARIFTSLLFLSAMAPFLLMVDPIGQAPVGPAQDSWRCRFSLSGYSRSGLTVVLSSAQAQEIGPQVTRAARDVAPFVVPKNRWEFAAMWGGLGSGSMMQNHVGSSHGSVLSDGVAAGGAAGGAAKDAPQKGSALLVAARAADDARAFWSYGPLVIFAGGVTISILVKFLALPLGGACTEGLYSLLRAQALQSEGDYCEGVAIAHDGGEDRGEIGNVEVQVEGMKGGSSRCSESDRHRRGPEKSGSSDVSGKRWPCTLDLLPETAAPLARAERSLASKSPEAGGDTERSEDATEPKP